MLLTCALAMSLLGCGPSAEERAAAARAVAAAKAEQEAEAQAAQFTQAKDTGDVELAAAYADLILARWPQSQAAIRIAPQAAALREQAAARKETRRLQSLWTYQTSPIGGGTQRTATLRSEDPGTPPITLVLRDHSEWGLSVFLMPGNDVFACKRCTAELRLDDQPVRRIAVTKANSKENPALFIDDEKTLITLLGKGQRLQLTVPVNSGKRVLVFSIGGWQPARFAAGG